jgi:sporulation protein YqfC
MGFREQLTQKMKLPRDLVLGAAVLTVTGRSEAYIENYRGIIEYTSERIRLQTKTCQMMLSGEGLHIDYYTEDEMKISGQIGEIRYC